jgi:excinuclease ABC subunit C
MLENIPKLPGIYIFKTKDNAVIYIGKAKNLRNRVKSYFKNQNTDWKVQELIKEHDHIEHIITKNEAEALLLEAQLIKKFKPKYNVLLKSGNPFIYLLINQNSDMPELKLVRIKKEKGDYYGPFLQKQKARKVYEYLLRTFKLSLCTTKIENGCLDYHLNKCAGNCLKNFNKEDYKIRIQLAKSLLDGNYKAAEQLIKNAVKKYSEELNFEKARNLAQYLPNLEHIFEVLKTGFSETKYSKEVTAATLPMQYKIEQPLRALEDLQILLKLDKKPQTIDCFDISHFQSSYLVGSCVRFTHGIPEKNKFRRFKIKSLIEQNDYAALQEIVTRRYRNPEDLPDIILIDGGKGQLSAVTELPFLDKATVISIAKREETIFGAQLPATGYKLDIQTPIGQLLIAIRDYAHHFAISYHKLLRHKNIIQ